LLDDAAFHESCIKVSKDPTPYFMQIGEHRVTPEPEKPQTPPTSPVDMVTTQEQSSSQVVSQPVSTKSTPRKKSKSKSSSAASERSQVGLEYFSCKRII